MRLMYVLPHQFSAVPLQSMGFLPVFLPSPVYCCSPSVIGVSARFHSSVSSCSPSVIWVSACFPSVVERFPAVVFPSMVFLPVFIHRFPAVLLQSMGLMHVSFGFQLFSFSRWDSSLFPSLVLSCSPSFNWVSACFLHWFPAVLLQSMEFLPVFLHQFAAVLLQSLGFYLFSSTLSSHSPSVNGVSTCFPSAISSCSCLVIGFFLFPSSVPSCFL